ncbi:MAG: GtrA family protein [Alphaproteobacteria bacterium]|nr:GtrA family protein [Alphaproteobacteria bacterium]
MRARLVRLSQSRFIRFAFVGAGGFLVELAGLALFINALSFDPYSARIISFLTAATFTWAANRTLTFQAPWPETFRGLIDEWGKFVAANGIGGSINYAIYSLLVALAPLPFGHPFAALGAGSLTGLVFNFLSSKHFVFKD